MCQCVEDSSFEKFSGGGGYGDGLFDYCVSPDPSFSQGSFLWVLMLDLEFDNTRVWDQFCSKILLILYGTVIRVGAWHKQGTLHSDRATIKFDLKI